MQKLDNNVIKWLKLYGYTVNILADDIKAYKDLKEYLKANYTYEYYFYCDLEIKKLSEKIFTGESMETKRRNFRSRFNKEKRRIIKEKYNLTR